MEKFTAVAHPNLAFVKYWGKTDFNLNLPTNSSISVNLSAATTTTSVQFTNEIDGDQVVLNGKSAESHAAARISKHLDRIRKLADLSLPAIVDSTNDFPASAGIASSASGFAALTLAATRAAGLDLSQKRLSILARQGSGSACRSIPDGYVKWEAGSNDGNSFAVELAPPSHWDLRVTTVIFSEQAKDISSSEGHRAAENSEYFCQRLETLNKTLANVEQAILQRDFELFGMTMEREAVSMHAIAMTAAVPSRPWLSGIYYWQPETILFIQQVQRWRQQGISVYFTIDAGASMHLICEAATQPQLEAELATMQAATNFRYIVSEPAYGARII